MLFQKMKHRITMIHKEMDKQQNYKAQFNNLAYVVPNLEKEFTIQNFTQNHQILEYLFDI